MSGRDETTLALYRALLEVIVDAWDEEDEGKMLASVTTARVMLKREAASVSGAPKP